MMRAGKKYEVARQRSILTDFGRMWKSIFSFALDNFGRICQSISMMNNVKADQERAKALIPGQHVSIRYKTERNTVRVTGAVESVKECGVAVWAEPANRWTPVPFKDILKVWCGND